MRELSFLSPTVRTKPFFPRYKTSSPPGPSNTKHWTLSSLRECGLRTQAAILTEFPRCTYSKSRFHSPQPMTLGLLYSVLSCSPVRTCRTLPTGFSSTNHPSSACKRNSTHRHHQRMNRFFLSAWLCSPSFCKAALPSCFVTHGFLHTYRFPF